MKNIFVISHPRSGLHLLAKMLDKELYVDFDNMDKDNFLKNKIIEGDEKILFTHNSPDMLEKETVSFILSKTKPILLLRDIKDALTSYAILLSRGKEVDFNKKLHSQFKKHIDMIEYSKNFLNWLEYKNNMLIINYEDLINDYEKQSKIISEYSGLPVRDTIPNIEDVELSRIGTIGDHINYLDQEIIYEIDQRINQRLKCKSEKECSVFKKSKRKDVEPKLAVITTFFNPMNYVNLRYNYLEFSKRIKEKADLFPIELSYTDEFFIEDENVIQLKGSDKNILWQKERLLNIALKNIPEKYTNIAWIDCDVIFENEYWVDEVNEKLKDYKVLQLFEKVKRLNENGFIQRTNKSIVFMVKDIGYLPFNNANFKGDGLPGFAWAIRREVIENIKFLDTMIVGGADSAMFFSFVGKIKIKVHENMNKELYDCFLEWHHDSFNEVKNSVNNISGDIIHLYHGKFLNRNYNKRYEFLKNNFDPKIDLTNDENGLWKTSDKLKDQFKKYFKNRDEDNNIIDINKYFDRIFVINLDKSTDRYDVVSKKLNLLNINYERFSAINGDLIDENEYDFSESLIRTGMLENKYALACLRSHIEIIKQAKDKKYKKILILEDDVLISKNIHVYIQQIKKIENWKMLYLGASQYHWDVNFIENFYFAKRTLGGFSYALDISVYDEILKLNKEKKSIDNLYVEIQKSHADESYVFFPNICIANVSESNIRKSRNQKEHNKKMKWDIITDYI